ncbi:acyltransferase [Chondromyces apiculatus]|nr:acyltransferase [Chondromyces apiculatus]
MTTFRRCTVLLALMSPLLALLVTSGCKEEEEVPPMATTTTTTTTTSTTSTSTEMVPEEDAGADAADDAADGGKKVVGTADPTGVRRCCQALRQNANSAPPEQKGGYLAAAGACDGLVNSAQGRQALSTLRSFLLGAQLPAACQ